jgi:hypothetical protein
MDSMTTTMDISPQVGETKELMKSVLIMDDLFINDIDSSPPPMAPVSDSDLSSASGGDLHDGRLTSSSSSGTLTTTTSTGSIVSPSPPPSNMSSEIRKESNVWSTQWSTKSDFSDSSSTRIENETKNWTGGYSAEKLKKISWGCLHVRLYAIIPGDNPACIYGPSVSLSLVHLPCFVRECYD